jgi:glycosyltransferase involved in cell wall biosynthesis
VGLAAAKGEWLTFLDDDDLWPDNKLSSQAQYLQEHPEVMAVSGKIQWFHAWDQQLQPVPSDQDQIIVHVNLGAYLLRRELLDRMGPLDPDLIFSEDVDFVLRLIDGGHSFAILPQVMLLYRRHEQSMTAQKLEREKIDYRKVLFASLKRRRHQVATKLEDYVVKA